VKAQTLSEKQRKAKRAPCVVQVVEHLPSKHQASVLPKKEKEEK
jgi:hypothetical protein